MIAKVLLCQHEIQANVHWACQTVKVFRGKREEGSNGRKKVLGDT